MTTEKRGRPVAQRPGAITTTGTEYLSHLKLDRTLTGVDCILMNALDNREVGRTTRHVAENRKTDFHDRHFFIGRHTNTPMM